VNTAASVRTEVLMGTLVTIDVRDRRAGEAVERAFEWFRQIESICTRFDEGSELCRLSAQIGVAVPVSDVLFETVRFALTVAEETGGAFDPTLGQQMAAMGFNREHRSGRIIQDSLQTVDGPATYRDVAIDDERRTITLRRPLLLDLGAVAKGFAVDMAARELQPFENFAIDAGGDLYLGGQGPRGGPWSIGIRHPRRDREVIDVLRVSDKAICTSGDYERPEPGGGSGHHILDPRMSSPATTLASVTVVAPRAMFADALATAAFVMGPADGLKLLERMDVQGLLVTPSLDRYETTGLRG